MNPIFTSKIRTTGMGKSKEDKTETTEYDCRGIMGKKQVIQLEWRRILTSEKQSRILKKNWVVGKGKRRREIESEEQSEKGKS